MTGFAALKGVAKGENSNARWVWEVRSVNARGLDLRLRLPEGYGDLEQVVRKSLSNALTRGNVSLTLRVQSNNGQGRARLDDSQLDVTLAALKIVEMRAEEVGVHLTASTAAEILSLRGVLDNSGQNDSDVDGDQAGDQAGLLAHLKQQVPELIKEFVKARSDEGQALQVILQDQLTQVAKLMIAATKAATDRKPKVAQTMRNNLAALLENADGLDEARLAQELALLAVKSDVTEELDRLNAHVKAADELLAAKGAVGRKFDFLMQEFNREANTLCSKSGAPELTKIGLDLKTLIDQMREQVQNVE